MALTADSVTGYTAGTWVLDPDHSEVTFSIRHLAISKVKGNFEKFDVTVVTGDNPEESKITASIDVSSINTGSPKRDGHLRTNDFFAIDEYPTIDFVSSVIRHEGEDVFIDGDITIRGVTKKATFTGEFGGIVVSGYGQTVAGGSFTTKINRHDFGVSWNTAVESVGVMLGDEVTINIEAQVILQP